MSEALTGSSSHIWKYFGVNRIQIVAGDKKIGHSPLTRVIEKWQNSHYRGEQVPARERVTTWGQEKKKEVDHGRYNSQGRWLWVDELVSAKMRTACLWMFCDIIHTLPKLKTANVHHQVVVQTVWDVPFKGSIGMCCDVWALIILCCQTSDGSRHAHGTCNTRRHAHKWKRTLEAETPR